MFNFSKLIKNGKKLYFSKKKLKSLTLFYMTSFYLLNVYQTPKPRYLSG